MYYVKVQDSNGQDVFVEASFEVYQLFVDEHKRLERERYERRAHWDSRGIEDYIIGNDPIAVPETLEDFYFNRETIKTILTALRSCTPTQQKRLILYVQGKSFSEIARIERCSKQNVRKSVELAIKKIRTFLF